MRTKFVWLFLVICGITAKANEAKDLRSANFIMPGCRAFISSNAPSNALMPVAGYCLGTVDTLLFVLEARMIKEGISICVPGVLTNEQLVGVVVRYVDQRPARMHEPFFLLAMEAMMEAWPCSK